MPRMIKMYGDPPKDKSGERTVSAGPAIPEETEKKRREKETDENMLDDEDFYNGC